MSSFANAIHITHLKAWNDSGTGSYSNLGVPGWWEWPPGIEKPKRKDEYSDEASKYLAGTEWFKVSEIEVFKLE